MDTQPNVSSSNSNKNALLVLCPDEVSTLLSLVTKLTEPPLKLRQNHDDDFDPVVFAYWIYQSRRMRDQFFNSSIFAEPAWDLLLASYCFSSTSQPLTVSSLCYSAGCPFSTALRWIDRLEKLNLLGRRKCSQDSRLIFVELTEEGRTKVKSYLQLVASKSQLHPPN